MGGGGWQLAATMARQAAERSSFTKKEAKLLSGLASAFPDRLSPDSQKFFGSFSKKNRFTSLHARAAVQLQAASAL
jgi:hypothetical protein